VTRVAPVPLKDAPLGERLKRLAASKGYTPTLLAHKLDCSVPHVSKMFNGKKRFTPKVLDKFILALDVKHMEGTLHRQAAIEYGYKVP